MTFQNQNFKVTEEMISVMKDSIWRESFKAVETKNSDLLYNSAINLMHMESALRLLKQREAK
jgi:hypothetical protein